MTGNGSSSRNNYDSDGNLFAAYQNVDALRSGGNLTSIVTENLSLDLRLKSTFARKVDINIQSEFMNSILSSIKIKYIKILYPNYNNVNNN